MRKEAFRVSSIETRISLYLEEYKRYATKWWTQPRLEKSLEDVNLKCKSQSAQVESEGEEEREGEGEGEGGGEEVARYYCCTCNGWIEFADDNKCLACEHKSCRRCLLGR
jgi:hypothetical protein